MRPARLLLLAAVLLVPAGAPAPADAAKAKRLKAFSSCAGVVGYGKRYARRVSTAIPLPVANPAPGPPAREDTAGGPVAESPASAPAPGQDFSGTNVQEAGVDEPDMVKTDGSRVFVATGGRLQVIEMAGAQPRIASSLALSGGFGHVLLLRGDRLLAIGSAFGEVMPLARSASSPVMQAGKTVISEIDVKDPAAPRVVRTLEADGAFVSARQRGRTARLVVSAMPRAVYNAELRSRRSGWMPRAMLARGRGKARRTGVKCSSVRHAPEFSGLEMVTVLTIDMDKGLPAVDSDSLMTSAETVYASERSLYVTTQRWAAHQPGVDQATANEARTAVHRFDASEPGRTTYAASGEVPGYLLSQFAMSEAGGRLRVASTREPPWFGIAEDRDSQSESFVTVLDERAGKLEKVGQVGGLGKGERIYAVRFFGDAGYVVTFRQVDPLYTIDLSNPERPKVSGELKILGYSAYLHPAGEGLLIGVGQDATEEGRTRGTQVSLFDVSDLAAPKRLHARALAEGSSSEAEYDHHAFLWWPARKLAVLPVTSWSESGSFSGAFGFQIDRNSGISEAGRITHDGGSYAAMVRRSLVLGDRLMTVSDVGAKLNALGSFDQLAWLPFASA